MGVWRSASLTALPDEAWWMLTRLIGIRLRLSILSDGIQCCLHKDRVLDHHG
jgi:hypothetical protein